MVCCRSVGMAVFNYKHGVELFNLLIMQQHAVGATRRQSSIMIDIMMIKDSRIKLT